MAGSGHSPVPGRRNDVNDLWRRNRRARQSPAPEAGFRPHGERAPCVGLRPNATGWPGRSYVLPRRRPIEERGRLQNRLARAPKADEADLVGRQVEGDDGEWTGTHAIDEVAAS